MLFLRAKNDMLFQIQEDIKDILRKTRILMLETLAYL